MTRNLPRQVGIGDPLSKGALFDPILAALREHKISVEPPLEMVQGKDGTQIRLKGMPQLALLQVYGASFGPSDNDGEAKYVYYDGSDYSVDTGSPVLDFTKLLIPDSVYLEDEIFLAMWDPAIGMWLPMSHISKRRGVAVENIDKDDDGDSEIYQGASASGVEITGHNYYADIVDEEEVAFFHDGTEWVYDTKECS